MPYKNCPNGIYSCVRFLTVWFVLVDRLYMYIHFKKLYSYVIIIVLLFIVIVMNSAFERRDGRLLAN